MFIEGLQMRLDKKFFHFFVFALLLIPIIELINPEAGKANESIAYRLKWLINVSTVGDVVALKQGFFARQGLDVDVKAGGPERDAIRELELGYAQFGVASADQVIRAKAKGASIVVLAQLFQVNPLQWIYRHGDITLNSITDLKGLSIGITYGGNDETIMRALLAQAGLNERMVKLSGVRYDYGPFLQKHVDIWPVYRNTQGIYLADKLAADGEQVAFFDPAAYGIRFVANSVVTSQKIFDRDPALVQRFLDGLLAGWRFAIDPANEKAVIEAVAQYERDIPKSVLRRQLAVTRQMIQPNPAVAVGHIDTKAWSQTETIMLQQKLIDSPVNVVECLRPQFAR